MASAAALVVVLGIALTRFAPSDARGSDTATSVPASGTARHAAGVSAAGRIEPIEPVTHVGAPYVNGHPARVAELRVREGESIAAGQVIASLDSRAQIEASLRQAEARIAMEDARLAQTKAPAKPSDLAVQSAEIARLQTSLETARRELTRYEALHQKNDVSTSELEAKRHDVENARRLLEQANARMNGLSEVRPEDVRVAEAALRVARADAQRLRVELDTTLVKAPAAGLVLRIHAHAGEEVGPNGVVDLAQTGSMGVLAEVYETDIARVKAGQKATVTSDFLPSPIIGTVTLVGSEIGRADLPPLAPEQFADTRVVRVQIRLPPDAPVSGFIHGKVTVVIAP